MAKKTASPIRSPAPTRESPEAERSDDQTTDAPSPALGDVKRSTSKERKRKAIEPPGSPRDSRGRSSSNETQHSDDCEPEAKEHSPGASVEPLDSPEDPTERPSSIKDQTCDGCDPEVEHQAPGASVEPVDSADDQGSCASDGKTKQCIPSAEPSDQRYWDNFDEIWFKMPASPSAAAPRDDCALTLSRAGHRARHGALNAAFIVFTADGADYIVAFDKPDDDQTQDHTLAGDCIGLFARGEYKTIAHLLEPLVRQLLVKTTPEPPVDTFESFLSRAEIYLRVVSGAETLEPYPDFRFDMMPEPIDWDLMKKRVSHLGGRIYQLSDVIKFRQLTRRVYEVTIDGETVIYKRAETYYSLRREMTGLQGAELLNIRAPRLVGVIGADTIWGGLLMTLVPASSDLSDLNCSGDSAPRLQATTAERQQWFDEISAAFDGFHRYGFAYGDVKPANILIDDDRQAWLIDFEGGVTQGWVDEDLLDTVEGDLQGLRRLREFLGLEE